MSGDRDTSQAIPTRKIPIGSPSELPHSYSSTPGGTLYSTTPGGTRIVYERSFLMNLRNSPISKTPPQFDLPPNLQRGYNNSCNRNNFNNRNKQDSNKNGFQKGVSNDDGELFPMDI